MTIQNPKFTVSVNEFDQDTYLMTIMYDFRVRK